MVFFVGFEFFRVWCFLGFHGVCFFMLKYFVVVLKGIVLVQVW